jgi:nucleotide-binding universal stress UspA family protein
MRRIVVGTDGSANAEAALRWAAAEAKAHGAELRVVHAWQLPVATGSPWVVAPLDSRVFEDVARRLLDDALVAVDPEVRTTGVLVEGGASGALVEQARDADLLVVGSRGHGGLVGLLLGSVAQQVVHHAPCPVTVVH